MQEVLDKAKAKMQKSIDVLAEQYVEVRAGRANPNVLNRVTVDYYGTATPINQLAAVSVAEAHVLMIQPWDPSSLPRDRKGHPDLRHRHQPAVGRQDDPPDLPGFDGRPPQGNRQGNRQNGRRDENRRALDPPRRDG